MKFVAVIAEAENERGLGKAVFLQLGEELANLFISLEQAIVVMGDLLTHEWNVRVIGRHGHFGGVDFLWRAAAEFAAA